MYSRGNRKCMSQFLTSLYVNAVWPNFRSYSVYVQYSYHTHCTLTLYHLTLDHIALMYAWIPLRRPEGKIISSRFARERHQVDPASEYLWHVVCIWERQCAKQKNIYTANWMMLSDFKSSACRKFCASVGTKYTHQPKKIQLAINDEKYDGSSRPTGQAKVNPTFFPEYEKTPFKL